MAIIDIFVRCENYTSHYNMRALHDNFRTIILVLLFESSGWMWNESFELLLRKCRRGSTYVQPTVKRGDGPTKGF